MEQVPDCLGMICGNGMYPITFANAARKAGVKRLVVAAFHDETQQNIIDAADSTEWFRVGQLSKMITFFKKQGVTQAVMVGQIAPSNLFQLRPDLRIMLMLAKLKQRNAESIFGAIADELAKDDITLIKATTFLQDIIPTTGFQVGPTLKERRYEDARYGFKIAKEVSRLDIGQTVVVKKGTVLAVEGFDGTNATIKRGGALGKGSSTMVKVSKPNQDLRFDVPVVGVNTIQTAAESGIDLIVIEANSTLIIEQELVIKSCHQLKVTLLALSENDHLSAS
jgi:hypothetical protein